MTPETRIAELIDRTARLETRLAEVIEQTARLANSKMQVSADVVRLTTAIEKRAGYEAGILQQVTGLRGDQEERELRYADEVKKIYALLGAGVEVDRKLQTDIEKIREETGSHPTVSQSEIPPEGGGTVGIAVKIWTWSVTRVFREANRISLGTKAFILVILMLAWAYLSHKGLSHLRLFEDDAPVKLLQDKP